MTSVGFSRKIWFHATDVSLSCNCNILQQYLPAFDLFCITEKQNHKILRTFRVSGCWTLRLAEVRLFAWWTLWCICVQLCILLLVAFVVCVNLVKNLCNFTVFLMCYCQESLFCKLCSFWMILLEFQIYLQVFNSFFSVNCQTFFSVWLLPYAYFQLVCYDNIC